LLDWTIISFGEGHMTPQTNGYYRFPTIHGDQVAFVAEDDLWSVDASGGIARRLTANLGEVMHPRFSPDGEWLAFVGHEEGQPEVYRVSALGGPARRLTYLGGDCSVVGWHEGRIVFASNAGQPFDRLYWLYAVDTRGGEPSLLPYGPARDASWGPRGVVIGRNTGDPARWKRYRGGTAGEIWIDEEGGGAFHKLIDLAGDLANPMWVGDRVYFLSDHEGVGNVYSCLPDGSDLRRHTDHRDFYARNAASDGRRIVYHAGADVYLFDPQAGESHMVEIAYHSPQIQRSRKFVSPSRYWEDYALSGDGAALALIHRGKAYAMGNWEGPVVQQGARNGVRYRLARWLGDGKRVVLVSDEGGEDRLEVHCVDGSIPTRAYPDLDLGRPRGIAVSPKGGAIVLSNHRHELIHVDLETGAATTIDRSRHGPIHGYDWSPDGTWVAYAFPANRLTSVIVVYDTQSGQCHPVTEPSFTDVNPTFDPTGRYLYFKSYRIWNPVRDQMQFDFGFPRAMRLYAIALRADVPSPFVPVPHGFEATQGPGPQQRRAPPAGGEPVQGEDPPAGKESPTGEEPPTGEGSPAGEELPAEGSALEEGQTQAGPASEEPPQDEGAPEGEERMAIDLEGIEDRVVPFPVSEGIYGQLMAIVDKVFYTTYRISGSRRPHWFDREPPANACLKVYDLNKLEEAVFYNGITGFDLSADGTAIACRIGSRLRVLPAKRDPSQSLPGDDRPGRKSGWVDLSRVHVSVDPVSEWRQMLREAWRLQRDHFWVEDMSGVDWDRVLQRYEPLVERVASRGEFSDLMWEMQGELGTSHAYEMGGDYRPGPYYRLGYLGADLAYDPEHDAYRFVRILRGDVWDGHDPPPLRRPGVNVEEGMLLLAIGGERVGRDRPPGELLVDLAGEEVLLTVAQGDGSAERMVAVQAARSEQPLRYRDWVEANRRAVHERTGGRVGYVHVPDMGPDGYAEFHRYFSIELDHEGLIVDVRFNGGGNVSTLLLGKLARKRIGYKVSRWMGARPYLNEAARGPMVALCNEHAASDGDNFSHGFKLLKLGKLIGRRTWGGVIGYWPRNWLVDGTLTTQPEFSSWFEDVGWGVENYGTDPDIEVDITPQDYARGVDTQLDRAIAEVLLEIERNPPLEPDLGGRPSLALPE
jgi:tricorn protease